jgi:hypothetical protein
VTNVKSSNESQNSNQCFGQAKTRLRFLYHSVSPSIRLSYAKERERCRSGHNDENWPENQPNPERCRFKQIEIGIVSL